VLTIFAFNFDVRRYKKEMKVIGEKYKKLFEAKGLQLKEDGVKFKGDMEQMKTSIGVVQKIVAEMQVPGAMEKIQVGRCRLTPGEPYDDPRLTPGCPQVDPKLTRS